MRKFFGTTRLSSAKNGEIVIHYYFWSPAVFVNGYDQSTDYTGDMWRRALRRLPQVFQAKKVLMLGLGLGSALKFIQRRFRGCQITVVEWDPVMIELYRELYKQHLNIKIIEGDATVIVPKLGDTFDLVLVDLFKGNVTPAELARDKFVRAIASTLTPTGYCLLNAFVSLELFPVFEYHLKQIDSWKYEHNSLALFKP